LFRSVDHLTFPSFGSKSVRSVIRVDSGRITLPFRPPSQGHHQCIKQVSRSGSCYSVEFVPSLVVLSTRPTTHTTRRIWFWCVVEMEERLEQEERDQGGEANR
jgi:hypothetical protein